MCRLLPLFISSPIIGIPPSWYPTFHGDQNPPFAYIHGTHPEGWLELGKRSYLERQLKKTNKQTQYFKRQSNPLI